MRYSAAISSLLTAFFLAWPAAALIPLAEEIPQSLEERSTASGGGWALSQGSCPSTATACSSGWCCPSSLTCVHMGSSFTDNLCCPGTTECVSAFQALPLCADDTWTLWNSTHVPGATNNFFCCLPGQVGLIDGTCVSADTKVAPSQSAISLLPSAASQPTYTSSSASGAASATSSSSATPSGGDNKSSFPASAIGGIVAGSLVAIFLIICAIFYAKKRSFRNRVNAWANSLGQKKSEADTVETEATASAGDTDTQPSSTVQERPNKSGFIP